MEWIKTSDRLPEDFVLVIGYAKGKKICCGDNESYKVIPLLYNSVENEWVRQYGEYSCTYEVTHWVELPEPPKDE